MTLDDGEVAEPDAVADGLRAQLAAVTRERDEAQAKYEERDAELASDEFMNLRAEIDRLVALLEPRDDDPDFMRTAKTVLRARAMKP